MRQHNRKSPEEKKAANKKAMGNVKKVAPKKDTRTDAQKMTDATGPRPVLVIGETDFSYIG